MRRKVERVLEKWGTDLILVRKNSETPVRGFFQYADSQSWQNMQKELSFLGEVPVGWYVYIGPAGTPPERGDRVKAGGKSYQFRRAEMTMLGNTPLYVWGLCVEEGSDRIWGR